MFCKSWHKGGFYPDLRINSCLSLNQENSFRRTGHVLFWAFMMDGAGRPSLWLTASLGVQTTTVCHETDIGLGPPAWLFFKPVFHLSLIPYPLSLSIHLSISPSRPSIQSSIIGTSLCALTHTRCPAACVVKADLHAAQRHRSAAGGDNHKQLQWHERWGGHMLGIWLGCPYRSCPFRVQDKIDKVSGMNIRSSDIFIVFLRKKYI